MSGPPPPLVKVVDPVKEYPELGRLKQQIECTSLYLARKNAERLVNLHLFPQLVELWVNGNRLTRIRGVESNTRLRQLYAHDNQISSLEGPLGQFRFLETLTLQNNKLRDLGVTIDALQSLRFLTNLNLFGNPIAEETNYRYYVIHRIPTLKILDRHEVTDDERRRADALAAQRKDRDHTTVSRAAGRTMTTNTATRRHYRRTDAIPMSSIERELETQAARIRADRRLEVKREQEELFRQAEEDAANRMRLRTPPLPKSLNFLPARREQLEQEKRREQEEKAAAERLLAQQQSSTTKIAGSLPKGRTRYMYSRIAYHLETATLDEEEQLADDPLSDPGTVRTGRTEGDARDILLTSNIRLDHALHKKHLSTKKKAKGRTVLGRTTLTM